GALTTYRMETNYKNELLVLDKSEYLGTEDYELEFEVNQYEEGLTKFNELLQSFNLAHQKPLNKVQRFFERKKELS
ncbi:CYTH domain-containing protein, partial [Staphylococcus cohnii]